MAEAAYRVLVVDDDRLVAELIGTIAAHLGFRVELTHSAAEFQRRYVLFDPHIIMLDLAMPVMDGIELLGFLERAQSKARIVIASGFDDAILEAAARLGQAQGLTIVGSLKKPIAAAALRALLDRARRDIEAAARGTGSRAC